MAFGLMGYWLRSHCQKYDFIMLVKKKNRKCYVSNGTVHSGCTDPTQSTARLIVLVRRIQNSGTGDNNFVKWKGTFRSDRSR